MSRGFTREGLQDPVIWKSWKFRKIGFTKSDLPFLILLIPYIVLPEYLRLCTGQLHCGIDMWSIIWTMVRLWIEFFPDASHIHYHCFIVIIDPTQPMVLLTNLLLQRLEWQKVWHENYIIFYTIICELETNNPLWRINQDSLRTAEPKQWSWGFHGPSKLKDVVTSLN